MSAGDADWDKSISRGREVVEQDLCDLLKMGAEKEGNLQQMVCYRSEDLRLAYLFLC